MQPSIKLAVVFILGLIFGLVLMYILKPNTCKTEQRTKKVKKETFDVPGRIGFFKMDTKPWEYFDSKSKYIQTNTINIINNKVRITRSNLTTARNGLPEFYQSVIMQDTSGEKTIGSLNGGMKMKGYTIEPNKELYFHGNNYVHFNNNFETNRKVKFYQGNTFIYSFSKSQWVPVKSIGNIKPDIDIIYYDGLNEVTSPNSPYPYFFLVTFFL